MYLNFCSSPYKLERFQPIFARSGLPIGLPTRDWDVNLASAGGFYTQRSERCSFGLNIRR